MKAHKIIISTILLVLALISAPSLAQDSQNKSGIMFYNGTWDEVLALAKKENKIVFVDIYASWCGPCKRLKANTFTDETVGKIFNANFINFAIDAEKGEGIKLANLYEVNAYPTLIFVDKNGKLISKTVGYQNPNELLQFGKKMKK